jgi:hypothetical protein
MITVNIYMRGFGSGGLTSNIRVTVQSNTNGIGTAQLRDHSGMPLTGLMPLSCLPNHVFDVDGIPSGQFPVLVWVDECTSSGQPSGQLIPYGPFDRFGGGGTPPGGAMPECPPQSMNIPPSLQCLAAKTELRRLRNQFNDTCDRVSNLQSRLTSRIAFAATLYALAVLLTVASIISFVQAGALAAVPYSAGFAPIAVAIGYGLLAAASVATTGAVAATVLAVTTQRELTAAERELNAARDQFRSAAMTVMQSCCPWEFLDGDVTLPMCH